MGKFSFILDCVNLLAHPVDITTSLFFNKLDGSEPDIQNTQPPLGSLHKSSILLIDLDIAEVCFLITLYKPSGLTPSAISDSSKLGLKPK